MKLGNKLTPLFRVMMKVNKTIYQIEKVFLLIITYGLVGILALNVLFRFALFIPSPWADEAGRYVFTWLVLLGSAVAAYNWEHIEIDMIDSIIADAFRRRPETGEKVLWFIKKLAVVVSIAFLVYLLIVYKAYLDKVVQLGLKSMFLGVGLVVPMSAFYVCGILMLMHAVCYLIIPQAIREQEG